METMAIGPWKARTYGERADGIVRAGDRQVRVTLRRQVQAPEDEHYYIMANGWTAGKSSMRTPALAAVAMGNTAVTFEYTNTKAKEALASNVEDLTRVIEALPARSKHSAIGLSMGGAVLTMAMEAVGDQVDKATLVAPGRFLRSDYYTPRVIGERLLAESLEIKNLRGNLRSGLHLLGGGIVNCARRPQAIRAEFLELLSGNVHDELVRVKQQSDSPFVRFMYGLQDELLPAYAQVESISGLPFDDVVAYEGGHARLAYDPTLSYDILELDNPALAA